MCPLLAGFIDKVTEKALAGPADRRGTWSLDALGLAADTALAAYRAGRPDGSSGDLLADVLPYWWALFPAHRVADAHAAVPPATYAYEFAGTCS